MPKLPNSQYNVAAAGSLPVRIAGRQRRRMFDRFLRDTGIRPEQSLLDVGVTSDRTYASSNYVEAWYPIKQAVTAVGLDDASFLEELYPGMRFVRADGLDLPFRAASFDVVHASAVVEHVGSFERQTRFIAECGRVARTAVFLTTPNRWFPVEFHTVLPLVHWLPKQAFRGLMRRTGREFFAAEENLNLMTARDLGRAARTALTPQGFSLNLGTERLAGWPANLILVARRGEMAEG